MNPDDHELSELLADLGLADRGLADLGLADLGTVLRCQRVGGGCISEAFRVFIRSSRNEPQSVLVKRNEAAFLQNFRCEAAGLRLLAAAGAIAVPQPLAVRGLGRHAWLVLPWIETAAAATAAEADAFFESFGRQLAELHRRTSGQRIGLDHDNFLGAAVQINTPAAGWTEFVQVQRLGFQLRWAVDQQLLGGSLQQELETLIARLPELLAGRAEQTSLLHGDLWSGNYLRSTAGQVVLIDPAVYYGCREAELGMLKLFGGCPPRFDRAYQAAWPMPAGWQRRVDVYVLYHLLNHLNLFGASYLGPCQSVVARLLRH